MYNICPRVRRTIRKSAVIGVIVSVTIPIILFGLTFYINDLMSNANKNKKKLADTVELNTKPISTNINCTCSPSKSSECDKYCNMHWINDLYQKHHTKIIIFIAILFLFVFIILSIIVLQYIVCVPKHPSNACNVERKFNTPQKYICTKTYI